MAYIKDPSNIKVIFPFGELKAGEYSWVPPKSCGDEENNIIYSADMAVNKIVGIKLIPAKGELTTGLSSRSHEHHLSTHGRPQGKTCARVDEHEEESPERTHVT